MDTQELYKKSLDLLNQHKSNEFIDLINNHLELSKSIDLARIYKKSCELGNVIVVDYLLNFPNNNLIHYDFYYHEAQSTYEKSIPNGAFLIACDHRNLDLMEYFIKNDIYYLCSDTYEGLEQLMPGAIKDIDIIEYKLLLQDKLKNKNILKTKNKI